MQKKYTIRLSEEERNHLNDVIKKLKGSGQKVRRAHILLKADADGAKWTDQQIAEAFLCRIKTVENIRQRFVLQGFEQTLDGKKREHPPRSKSLPRALANLPLVMPTGHYAC
uniref:Homeodomain-like domain-containing protein n=1 Tax=Candidatus Kentrum eta TaxID=2126337 RepID=A0A450VKX5_9GAMM|nr:MAG: Homeodomain-like domain-containing protein [Candidatus Kentron sp. H]VFK05117.1 MAG: Homeodomain-like domain-containing protein [Candidatus Kentron sp. H]VFK05136.1 MAG: Homeodomain-like domain-containing protein [Candidatus Kentron sp. H]VFK05443.1 MAG: Homeodomain-like domain-containing protein [Candidatus Kentron sp. H]VFK06706.1 MAG: Homeodomain-like domain-containing protein [Candidatus Kentron sp. H]